MGDSEPLRFPEAGGGEGRVRGRAGVGEESSRGGAEAWRKGGEGKGIRSILSIPFILSKPAESRPIPTPVWDRIWIGRAPQGG